ncbi:response regulator transcription factor [Pseudoalteromonas denitrificans]|uniref:DNA-binding response regulator, OmpR family, contains REC and winged-helix (WHTH) domain n=1 Tax=Pseudoalteromonas denitrificans DSM 6059 TaxID=1123010 RepID=A0A1I1NMJ2_9GAMM|nr:response regulator transcription factor [Pseudoalteromonas denitrificans]SFC98646.1 DNA-binding response regulator, OmpR family, contains REC and winged-helix (wHTH) domain [Pseudoalteromonas denitrificans DSM 6059]
MKKIKILIIEDDAEISRLTAMYLEVEGFESKIVDDGEKALATIKHYLPDLIILDLMLPGMTGIEICKQSRAFYQGPILVLTACDDDVSEVSLLKLGADDFLTKPLKPHVLVARIEALMRRSKPNMPIDVHTGHSKIHIDQASQQVIFEEKELILTSSEYEMLVLLERNIGNIVSRADCCQALRGINYDFNDRSIDMRISGLRKKLNDDHMPYKIITTVRNKGYMLFNG